MHQVIIILFHFFYLRLAFNAAHARESLLQFLTQFLSAQNFIHKCHFGLLCRHWRMDVYVVAQ